MFKNQYKSANNSISSNEKLMNELIEKAENYSAQKRFFVPVFRLAVPACLMLIFLAVIPFLNKSTPSPKKQDTLSLASPGTGQAEAIASDENDVMNVMNEPQQAYAKKNNAKEKENGIEEALPSSSADLNPKSEAENISAFARNTPTDNFDSHLTADLAQGGNTLNLEEIILPQDMNFISDNTIENGEFNRLLLFEGEDKSLKLYIGENNTPQSYAEGNSSGSEEKNGSRTVSFSTDSFCLKLEAQGLTEDEISILIASLK